MRKEERAALIMQRLEQHYPTTPVPLDHRDPVTLLVAVLLSAQCTDKKVNEVTPALFAAGPDPAAMASGVGPAANKAGVTSFTFLSVHWALSNTAINKVKASL